MFGPGPSAIQHRRKYCMSVSEGQCHRMGSVTGRGSATGVGSAHRRGSVTGGAGPGIVTAGAVLQDGKCHRKVRCPSRRQFHE